MLTYYCGRLLFQISPPLNNLIIIANTEAGHLTDPIFVQQIQSKGPHDGMDMPAAQFLAFTSMAPM